MKSKFKVIGVSNVFRLNIVKFNVFEVMMVKFGGMVKKKICFNGFIVCVKMLIIINGYG